LNQEWLTDRFWLAGENLVLLPERSADLVREIGQTLQALQIARAVIFQSSGTTGAARFVVHSREALLASARAVNAHLEARYSDVWLCALPVFHVGGFAVYARAYCSKSRVYEFHGKWDADRFVEQCIHHCATLSSLVPTQVHDLVKAGIASPPTLRAILVGGGQLDQALELEARHLGWPILRTYGLSEAASQVATQRGDALILLPHLEAALGENGRLRLRGASLLNGYLSAREDGGWSYEDPKDERTWFLTDDVVELDGDELRFIARRSSQVKILGELVDVESIERAFLQALPRGLEVALIDVPDIRSQNALVAAFTDRLQGEWLEAQIHSFNATLAGFERIARATHLARLPRGPLGKLRRGELRRLLLEAEK